MIHGSSAANALSSSFEAPARELHLSLRRERLEARADPRHALGLLRGRRERDLALERHDARAPRVERDGERGPVRSRSAVARHDAVAGAMRAGEELPREQRELGVAVLVRREADRRARSENERRASDRLDLDAGVAGDEGRALGQSVASREEAAARRELSRAQEGERARLALSARRHRGILRRRRRLQGGRSLGRGLLDRSGRRAGLR